MPSEFDDREFPIVRLRPIGASTDDDVRERLAFLDRQLARGRFALVFDTRRSTLLTAAQRRVWGDWLVENERIIRKNVAGSAILVGSAAGRGVFTAIFWLFSPPFPCVFVGTDEEAERVVRTQLDRAARLHDVT